MLNTGTLTVTTPSDREVRMTRVFGAPRELVFEALTNPELLKRWFGPHGWTLTTCEVDLRVGGAWRYVLHGPDDRSMGMGGVFQEITPGYGTVHTEVFDDYPHESVVTIVLTEEDGKTTLTGTVLCESREVRDAVIATGMEHGAAETYDRLADLLPSLH